MESVRPRPDTPSPLVEFLGDSPGVRAVRDTVTRLVQRQGTAGRLPPILFQGETGTGKGLLARLLHQLGPRRTGPFVDVNCAAIPETLLEAELFGFERGAFTDARQAKPGLFQTAHHGMLFLDEIGLLPEGLQGKLLTVIEERTVRRLGSTKSEPVDVWIVTATNEDLATSTRQGRFREDLYHRLAVLTVALPPLRERGPDTLLLAEHFLIRACADYGLPSKGLGPDAREALLAYAWPGNIRELANVMERVALLAEAPLVTAELLGLPAARGTGSAARPRAEGGGDADDAVARLERERDDLLDALHDTDWNISRAAARLGLPRNTVRYRIAKHRLSSDLPRPGGGARAPAPASPAAPAAKAVPPVTAPAPAAPAAPPSLRWATRRLTFLRAVLDASSGPEAAADATRALEVLVEKVQTFGGRVEELSPNGLVAAFGLEPLEDAARRAAHAAMAIQKRALRASPERPAVRLALHTAEVSVGHAGGVAEIDADARREAWATLDALAHGSPPDTIGVSAAAAPFLTRRFELVPLDAPPAAGGAYRLVGLERTAFGQRLATFVGRHDELTLLQSRLATACRGHGQIVGIGGEAGIGKSRLLFELRQRLASEPVTYLEGHCVPYGTTVPYLPIIEMLRQNCRIGESDGPEVIAERVRAGVRAVGMDADAAAPYLLHLLGVKEGTEQLADLAPEAVQSRTFQVMWQLSLEGSRRRPLILALEDIHWIDRASEAYLDSLVESLAGAAILLVLTYRPGSRPRWIEKSYATQISLQPLDPEESFAVVRSVLPASALPDDLARRLVEKAEGNPFFLEELAWTVDARREPGPDEPVPDTIQEVLVTRIDRLPEAPRHLVQTAAVLGREVPRRLLAAVWEGPGDLESSLRELMRLEFLYDRPGGDEPVYVFRHALTREVARESLPAARRQAVHAAGGRALEGLYAGRLEEVYDRLAYHYAKGKQADKAVEYLGRFAEKAARRHAHVEAVAALQESLKQSDRLPAGMREARRLDLVLQLAHCLSFLGRFPETRDLLLGEQGRLERQAAPPALVGPYHFWLAHTLSYLGEYELAAQHAHQALDAAGRHHDEATMGRAYLVLAQAASWGGQPILGIARGRRAAGLLAAAGERWWLGQAHWIVGINYITIGAFDLALDAEARALAVGEALGDRRIESYATWTTGWIQALTGNWAAAIEACRRALGQSPDPLNTATVLGHLGYVHLAKGEVAGAVALLEEAVAKMRQFGVRQLEGRFMTFLGEAYLVGGQVEAARELVSEAMRLSAGASYSYGLGWARHAMGRIALAGGDLAAADTYLTDALETFTRTYARFLVARTRLSLAGLAHARNDRPEVARQLDAAYAAFRMLRIPHYVAETERLARELAVSLEDETIAPGLAIVRRGETELFATLEEHREALNLRQVIWDRRREDQRGRVEAEILEHRGEDRRRPAPPTWGAQGFLIAP
jgi:DNA-binding NtrC family response regulator/tetratricopeptide (TPR) repeat protein